MGGDISFKDGFMRCMAKTEEFLRTEVKISVLHITMAVALYTLIIVPMTLHVGRDDTQCTDTHAAISSFFEWSKQMHASDVDEIIGYLSKLADDNKIKTKDLIDNSMSTIIADVKGGVLISIFFHFLTIFAVLCKLI